MPLLHHALIHAVFSVTLRRVAPSSPCAGCRPHSGQQGEGACAVGTISLCKESLLRPQVSMSVQSVMTWRETRSCARAAVRGRAEGGNPAGVRLYRSPALGSAACPPALWFCFQPARRQHTCLTGLLRQWLSEVIGSRLVSCKGG